MTWRICIRLLTLITVLLFSCKDDLKEPGSLFKRLLPEQTAIHFENVLQSTGDFNIIQYLYYYNGGGVAVGDINNDGLADIYFSSNQHSNRLYLNKGNFRFEDITEASHAGGQGNWKTGVSMADVNGDGFLDIFICGVGKYKNFTGRNQLLINNGDLTFSDRTNEFGLSFEGFSSQASFFDYDNDGDLDMFLVNHSVHTIRSYGPAAELRYQTDSLAGDKLYRNELYPSGKAGFTDVTLKAGILTSQIGYGLSVSVSDLNKDGFPDIYVTNDFNENDYLYLNNGDGTFKQTLEKSIPHSSRFSMGSDIADINNDGLTDIMTVDMLPSRKGIIKTTAGEDDYEIYDFKLRYGYHHQFLRNALQLNHGVDDNNELYFSDIAPFAGVEATDWSWSPLLADFDNDGFKDLFITTGIVGRPNDLDYINYISHDSVQELSDDRLIKKMPTGKSSSKMFRNMDDLRFNDVTLSWMDTISRFSTGAAYADFDNDGDLDLVVNNINEVAGLYRNDQVRDSTNSLALILRGTNGNQFGVGAAVTVYASEQIYYQEQIPVRGWLSSVDNKIIIGLGKTKVADSIIVRWPGGHYQKLSSVKANQTLELKHANASPSKPIRTAKALRDVAIKRSGDLPFKHQENKFIAFSSERLIPHMASSQGPHIATGDIDSDGLSDVYVCGGRGQSGVIFKQSKKGFDKLNVQVFEEDKRAEDTDAIFLDADQDGDQDLVVVAGGQEVSGSDETLSARLYLNDGRGQFVRSSGLAGVYLNASCVRAADIDNDGDLDLFIGGRVISGNYGIDARSFILLNDGKGNFVDGVDFLPDQSLGMVTDGLWTDINDDKRMDLVVVGEWMPITILLQNDRGTFDNRTADFGLDHTNGWWNVIRAHDMDGDGDIDFMAGNLGLNARLHASEKEPVTMYVSDLDKNNSLDHILTYYNDGESFPFLSRNQLIKQVPSFRRKFLLYHDYKDVVLKDLISNPSSPEVLKKDAYTFASSYIENLGGAKFKLRPFPLEAQLFPIFAFGIFDINKDGFDDLIAAGNFYDVQPDFGRYDAGYGATLIGDGAGNFSSQKTSRSGFLTKGQVRDIAIVEGGERKIILVARNDDSVEVFVQE